MKYLSIIYVARNDEYIPGSLSRFQNSLNNLSYLLEKYNFCKDVEIITVEWNPFSNRPYLKDAIKWPKNVDCRIIVVPKSAHDFLPPIKWDADNYKTIPFHEFIAKNVGIRRCNSEFILCTNIDIIFNKHFIKFLSQKKLSNDRFYRIDKENVTKKVDTNLGYKEQMKFFERNLDPKLIEKNIVCRKRYVHTKASGDFLLAPKWAWEKSRGYPEIKTGGGAIDRFGLYCMRTICKQIILDPPMRMFHQFHETRDTIYLDKNDRSGTKYETKHSTYYDKNRKKWFFDCFEKMEKEGKNLNVNSSNWGLIDNIPPLKEIIIKNSTIE